MVSASAALAVGCGGGGGSNSADGSDREDSAADANLPPDDPTRLPSTTPAPEPTAATTTPTSSDDVTIAFAGDVHFEGELRSRLDDPETALAPITRQLSAADLTVVNLETSIGTSGTPEPKRYTFQAPPTTLGALAVAGVDVVTMANNHGVDFGPAGLADTLSAAAEAGTATPALSVVGIGADAARAFAPAVHDVEGTRIAVLGASLPDDPTADPTAHWAATDTAGGIAVALDPARLLQAVRAARDQADLVVVYLHWGVQGERCPSPSQMELAGALADAGADVVVGSHAHRLQGAGLLGETYVAYGLGNFVWYTQSPTTSATGILTLTIAQGRVVEDSWTPARIGAAGLPAFATGDEARQLTLDFAALRECTDLTPVP